MEEYRAVKGKEAPWQTKAVKTGLRLFDGLFEKTEENGAAEKAKKQAAPVKDRICFPGLRTPVGNPEMRAGRFLRENLKSIQRENHIGSSETEEMGEKASETGNSFSMEIPQGEGRFFVMLRLILEMNRRFGLIKFIIAVPSVAERLNLEAAVRKLSGPLRSLGCPDMEECFFTFSGERTGEISAKFVERESLSVCIMNIQAFNRATNRLRAEDEYGQILWEDICSVCPAVIADGFGRQEGNRERSSRALDAIRRLNPLFTMWFEEEAGLQHERIFSFSQKEAGQWVKIPRKAAAKTQEEAELRTAKIRKAVKLHFQTQLALLKEGKQVKVLTLFLTGAFGRDREKLLEEFGREYLSEISRRGKELEPVFKQYGDGEQIKDPAHVRRVFLGADKKGRIKELDGWERGGESPKKRLLEDAHRGIKRLLEEGEELKSFQASESFLFVHPALWEGCRNSNVFVMVSLDKEGEKRKKEEHFQWPCEDQEGSQVSGGTAGFFWEIEEPATKIREFPQKEKAKEAVRLLALMKNLREQELREAVSRLNPDKQEEFARCAGRLYRLLDLPEKEKESFETERM